MSEQLIIKINQIEIKVTPQVIYDAYYMSLPEFVTYYRVTNRLPLASMVESDRASLEGTPGVILRNAYFELRDKLSVQELKINQSLNKSCLRKWLEKRDLSLKDLGNYPDNIEKFQVPEEDENYVEDGDDIMSDDFDISFLSQKEQIEFCLDNGIEKLQDIAKKMSCHPRDILKLKQQVVNDR